MPKKLRAPKSTKQARSYKAVIGVPDDACEIVRVFSFEADSDDALETELSGIMARLSGPNDLAKYNSTARIISVFMVG